MGQRAVRIPQLILFLYKAAACPYDNRIKQQQDRRKCEYYRHHTDQGASGHQHAQGGNYGYARIHSHAEGCREEGHRTDEYTLYRCFMGDQNRLLFALSASSLNLIPASHQDRVVNGGSQLDRSDDD